MATCNILQENGGKLLQENSSRLLIENCVETAEQVGDPGGISHDHLRLLHALQGRLDEEYAQRAVRRKTEPEHRPAGDLDELLKFVEQQAAAQKPIAPPVVEGIKELALVTNRGNRLEIERQIRQLSQLIAEQRLLADDEEAIALILAVL